MELLASRYQTIPLYSSQNCLSDFCSLLLFTCQCTSSNMRLIRFFRSWSGSHVAISYSSSPSSWMECPSVSNAGSLASPVNIEYLGKSEHICIKIAGIVWHMVCLFELDQLAVLPCSIVSWELVYIWESIIVCLTEYTHRGVQSSDAEKFCRWFNITKWFIQWEEINVSMRPWWDLFTSHFISKSYFHSIPWPIFSHVVSFHNKLIF